MLKLDQSSRKCLSVVVVVVVFTEIKGGIKQDKTTECLCKSNFVFVFVFWLGNIPLFECG